MIKETFKPALTIDQVFNFTCDHYKIDKNILLTKNRKSEIKEVRQIFQSLARTFTTLSLDKIGKFNNGNYDHSTVLHSIKIVQNHRETEKRYNYIFTKLEKRLMMQNYLALNGTTTMSAEFATFVNDLDVVYTIV